MLRTMKTGVAIWLAVSAWLAPSLLATEGQDLKTFKRTESKNASMAGPLAGGAQTKWIKQQAREMEALDGEIEAVNQLIEMSDPTDLEVPDYHMRLADLYWEKSLWYENQIYSESLADRLDRAEREGDAATLAALRAKKAEHQASVGEWRDKTIATYQSVAETFPNHPAVDVVYYYLGIYLTAMGRPDEGRDFFIRVVTEHTRSRLFPDALFNIGDSFFAQDDFESALKFYERVEIFTDSHVFLIALYKKAWCHFNMAEYQIALKSFVKTIRETDKYAKRTGKAKLDLRDEALRDLVLTYSQIGKPENALATFKKIAAEDYLELSKRLARIYYEQGSYNKSNIVLKYLMKAEQDSFHVLAYQRMVIDNAHKKGEFKRAVDETQRLVQIYPKYSVDAPPKFLTQERELFSQQLRELATSFHEMGRRLKNPKVLNMAHLMYGMYFEIFPKDSFTQDMATNYSVLLLNLELYDKAVVQFERLLTMKLTTEQEKMAAHGAVVCYFHLYDVSQIEGGREEEVEALEPEEIPDNLQRFVTACDRYVSVAAPTDEDYIESKFASAKILFDFNHFQDAAKRFADMVVNHETEERAKISARLLLASYNLGRDVDNLNRWASKLKGHPAVLTPKLTALIKVIEDRAEFNRCFAYEQKKQFQKAAICFAKYTLKFPDSKILDRALYNSAINYNRARMMEKAIAALGDLYNRARKSTIRPSALFALAEIYREAAVYSEAAKFYEVYVKKHSTHKHVEKALQYASVFRKALGQYRKAIQNYKLFMRSFKKSDKIPNVDFDIGMIYMTQTKYREATRHFGRFAKRYPMKPDLVLGAQLQIAKAWSKLRDRNRTKKAYEAVVATYEQLTEDEKKGLTSGVAIVAEARFLLGEFVLEEYHRIKITTKTLEKALKQKLEIIARAKPVFQEVYQMNQPNWMIAALDRLAWAYQQLADTIENAPLPKRLNEEQLEIYRADLAEKSEKIRKLAVDAYKKCLEEAIRFKWFNEYSEHAERNLAKLDFSYRFTKETRAKPHFVGPNGNPFSFVRAQLDTGLEL
jgi:cellulose synthase operon protein C